VGAPHQSRGAKALNEAAPAPVRVTEVAGIALDRQVVFWLLALAAVILVLWILGPVLLPFVAAMALAYILDPLTTKLQRCGIYRPLAALATIGSVVLALVVLILLIAPILVAQLSDLGQNIPGYVRKAQKPDCRSQPAVAATAARERNFERR
jgi:predicted PurR-regulated permease PerM